MLCSSFETGESGAGFILEGRKKLYFSPVASYRCSVAVRPSPMGPGPSSSAMFLPYVDTSTYRVPSILPSYLPQKNFCSFNQALIPGLSRSTQFILALIPTMASSKTFLCFSYDCIKSCQLTLYLPRIKYLYRGNYKPQPKPQSPPPLPAAPCSTSHPCSSRYTTPPHDPQPAPWQTRPSSSAASSTRPRLRRDELAAH